MARTVGAVSVTNITMSQLVKLVGPNYNGQISIGAKWLQSIKTGDETTRVIIKTVPKKQKAS